VRDGRQKSAEAVAEDPAYTLRLKYTGVQGLELAATAQYQTEITQGIAQDDASATLFETHAIYQTGPFALRALWASWDIDGNGFSANGRDSQEGWYLEPSYKPLENLGFFTRYSEYNNEAGINSNDVETWDYGLNYWLHPRVVLKADYSDIRNKGGNDSLNLGLGWSF
jgi:predicted porin